MGNNIKPSYVTSWSQILSYGCVILNWFWNLVEMSTWGFKNRKINHLSPWLSVRLHGDHLDSLFSFVTSSLTSLCSVICLLSVCPSPFSSFLWGFSSFPPSILSFFPFNVHLISDYLCWYFVDFSAHFCLWWWFLLVPHVLSEIDGGYSSFMKKWGLNWLWK